MKMNLTETFLENFQGAVTLTDNQGVIIYMNKKARTTFQKQGGEKLLGTSLYECHNESSKEKIKNISETKTPNYYTIEKNGLKKLIYQAPFFDNEVFMGLMELSLEIPKEMPHFIRS